MVIGSHTQKTFAVLTLLVIGFVYSKKVNAEETTISIKKTELEEKLSHHLKGAYLNKGSWKLISVTTHTPIYVVKGLDWSIELPNTPSRNVSVLIKESTSGKALGWAQATLQRMDPYYVAKRSIRSGEALKTDDFILEAPNEVNTAAQISQNDVVIKGEFPQNMRTKFGVIKGSPLVLSALEKNPEVIYGETITLIMRSDNVKLTTKAISQGKGAIGDTIPVLVKTYNKTFRGKIVQGKQVEVWL